MWINGAVIVRRKGEKSISLNLNMEKIVNVYDFKGCTPSMAGESAAFIRSSDIRQGENVEKGAREMLPASVLITSFGFRKQK